MDLGLSPEELLILSGPVLKSSIDEARNLRERVQRISLGEFPSEEKALNETLASFQPADVETLFPALFFAMLKLIDMNNKQIAKQLEPFIATHAPEME